MLLGSAHQMGTARINPNPEHGVVDLDGKVHGLDNVYIVDASTFPRCSGVNPMISIQSMSHFLMSKIYIMCNFCLVQKTLLHLILNQ